MTEEEITIKYKGQTNGRLTVIRFSKRENSKIYLLCRCDCGRLTDVYVENFKRGAKSCGAHKSEDTKKRNLSHNKTNSSEYRIWAGIKTRCTNLNRKCAKDYIGRGIVMCDRWLNSFENFYEDMGDRPSKLHSIERNDNDGIYSKENCSWALRAVQNSNTRSNVYVQHEGHNKTVSQWALQYNIPVETLARRVRKNLPLEKIFFTGNLKFFPDTST